MPSAGLGILPFSGGGQTYPRAAKLAYTAPTSSLLKGRFARRCEVRTRCGVPAGSADVGRALGAASGSPRVHYEALPGAG